MNAITVDPNVYKIRLKIQELLSLFSPLSRTMISGHVASLASYHGIDWTVILDGLVADGTVIREAKIIPNTNRSVIVYSLA